MDSQEDWKDEIFSHLSSGENFIISSQRVKKLYEKMWSETRKIYGLTQNEIDVLLFLESHPTLDTAADVARYRSLSRSQVCKSVEQMLENGYLEAEQDKHDRRYQHLKLTKSAGDVLKNLQHKRKKFWEMIQYDITVEELEVFFKVLEKMRGNLKLILPKVESIGKAEKE